MGNGTKKMVAVLAGAVVLVLIGLRVYDVQQEQAAGPKAGATKKGGIAVTVSLAEARSGEVREELLLTGALKPKEQVDIVPKAQGRVEQLYFQVGDLVRMGSLVAELDDDELLQQVNRATASIEVSRASLLQREAERDNANAELERASSLLKEELIAPQDFESRRTGLAVVNAQVSLARAQVEQAEAELRELKIRLDQTKIYAPLSGIAATRNVDVGAVVSPTTPILRVVNLSTMVTQAYVPERNLGKLRVGNEAIVNVDAIPDGDFRGRIARIAPVLDAATRTALVEIDIPNPQNTLKAEMFARIQLDLGSTRQATLIPREGLVYRGQQPGVYLLEDGRPVFRAIETGMTREDEVEVLANLTPGTRIIGRGASMLQEGARVVVAEDAPAKTADSPQATEPAPPAGSSQAKTGQPVSQLGGSAASYRSAAQ